MFDLRYHVASLAAVFVALLIGILVGVAMSGKVDDAEKQALKSDVRRLNAEVEAAGEGRANFTREQASIRAFVKNAYPSLIAGRLAEKRIGVIFAGTADAGIREDIERTIADAGAGTPTRMRALNVPIDVDAVGGKLNGDLRQYRDAGLDELGRALADEFVDGGDTPAWSALTSVFVEEKSGSFRRPAGRCRRRTDGRSAERRDESLPLRPLLGPRGHRRPDDRCRDVRRRNVRGEGLERGRALDRRRRRCARGAARARAAPLGKPGWELRREEIGRRRDRSAHRAATGPGGWLSRSRSSSPPATRSG